MQKTKFSLSIALSELMEINAFRIVSYIYVSKETVSFVLKVELTVSYLYIYPRPDIHFPTFYWKLLAENVIKRFHFTFPIY